MKEVVLQVVVVASGLALALPPGCCGAFNRQGRTDTVPARMACCHRTASGSPSESNPLPVRRAVECCCRRDATVPEKLVQPVAPSATALLFVGETPDGFVGQFTRSPAGVVLLPGPLLHVLQCVWRC